MTTHSSPKSFDQHMVEMQKQGASLVVQPRMGFSPFPEMFNGIAKVRGFDAGPRVATVTIDAKTRQNKYEDAAAALAKGIPLNGYPIVAHGPSLTSKLHEASGADCPIQMRHGTPFPKELFSVAAKAEINATEGGPISYNLPYGRVPLTETVDAWKHATTFWAEEGEKVGRRYHLETFGGCLMGQMAPPSLLVAVSLLEGIFFVEQRLRSISLSIAQGTNSDQDIGAIITLKKLASELLPANVNWHIVMYCWMGVFPQTIKGAEALIKESGRIAAVAGADRIIVKTSAEARQIPTVQENLHAMKITSMAAQASANSNEKPSAEALAHAESIYDEANRLITTVLNLQGNDLGTKLVKSFQSGCLDIPYCLHPDVKNHARANVDPTTGVIRWVNTANLPVSRGEAHHTFRLTPTALLRSLNFNRVKFDQHKETRI